MFALHFVFLLSRECYCSVSVPPGALSWSVVCHVIVAIPSHTNLLFYLFYWRNIPFIS